MPLEGTLRYPDIANLVKVVESSKKSGVLEIRWEEREARLFLQRGRLVRAESNRISEGIGTLLVKAGVLDPEALEQALEIQRAEGAERRLGAILCDEFSVQSADIERLLRGQFERIVHDVFSWPGGELRFHFQDPEAVLDRFNLDAMDFILQVGIRAGVLAEEELEKESRNP